MTVHDRLSRISNPLYAKVVAARHRAGRRTFQYAGRDHRYFCHEYNDTWRNERAVEVPLALEVLRGRSLEVGNVLWHYGVRGHTVVDKYEESEGVLNVDALDFNPGEHFDAIVSISTVEHMGFDEDEQDPAKPANAISHLASLLAPGGILLVTIPMAYNPAADAICAPDAPSFDEVGYLRRVGSGVQWEEAGWDDVRGLAYDSPYPAANGLAIGVVRA